MFALCRSGNQRCNRGEGQSPHSWQRLLAHHSMRRESICKSMNFNTPLTFLGHSRPIVLPRYVLVALESFVPSQIQPSNPFIWNSMEIMRENDWSVTLF